MHRVLQAIYQIWVSYFHMFHFHHVCELSMSWGGIWHVSTAFETETERDWNKFIQHNMTLYRCMISDIHDSSYVLFSTNLISNTNLHVGRPLLRPFLVAYSEATLARQKKDSATNEKWWHHFRILIADKWSVVSNECKNREFLLTGWKSLWSLATWLVISDRYIGEVIL